MNRSFVHRPVVRVALSFVGLLVATLIFVKLRYGLGSLYPDVNTPPRLAEKDVEILAELDMPLGNVTSSSDGRIFFNIHPFTQSHRFTSSFLFEIKSGKPEPFPDISSQQDLKFVFGMTVDSQNRLWITSPATLDRAKTRLIAYDLNTNTKVIDHELESGVARFGQDLRISPDGKTLFLADTGAFRFTHASIVVIDIATWTAREVLANDPSTQPQNWVIRTRSGVHRIGFGLLSFQVGVDGIALSRDGEWLYYATMSHDTLYRIKTSYLLDSRLSPNELAAHIETIGKKPLSDGIEVAPDGSVLLTDVEHGSIVRVDAAGKRETLVRLGGVVWSDGVNITTKGDVLFTDSSIPSYIDQLLRPPALEKLKASKPYRLYRFPLPSLGTKP